MTRYHLISAVLLLLSPAPLLAQQPTSSDSVPVVVTQGDGLVTATPDRAWVSLAAESRASNAKDAQRRNAELMRPVQERLRAAGIPDDAIRTTGYDLQYEWDYVDGKRVGRGYVARNSIEIRVDAIDRVGEILELAVSSGATSVGGIRFDLKNQKAVEQEALRLAVADARARAEAAATGAGQAIDRVLRIEEQGAPSPPVPMRTFALKAEAASSDAPPIAAGQLEFRAQVTLTASLK
jgi:uncharacterized protein YggE